MLDLDGGRVGATLVGFATNSLPIPGLPAQPFTAKLVYGLTLSELARQVGDGGFNAAWVAMPGASAALDAARYDASVPYSAASALTFVVDEGRGGSVMAGILKSVTAEVAAVASAVVATELLANATGNDAGRLNPAAFVAPLAFATMNLHPVKARPGFGAGGCGMAWRRCAHA